MKATIEILVPDISKAAREQLVGAIRDAVAGVGLTPNISTYAPEPETLAALDSVTPAMVPSNGGTFTQPTAAIRVFTV